MDSIYDYIDGVLFLPPDKPGQQHIAIPGMFLQAPSICDVKITSSIANITHTGEGLSDYGTATDLYFAGFIRSDYKK